MNSWRRSFLTFCSFALAASLVAGCQTAKVGAKCSPNGKTGRNATAVLVCRGGRWVKLISIADGLKLLAAKTPADVIIQNPLTSAATVGGADGKVTVRVIAANMNPIGAGVAVTFQLPSSGTGGTAVGATTVETDADGYAVFHWKANTAGSFHLTATAGNLAPKSMQVMNNPAAPATIEFASGQSFSIAAGGTLDIKLRALDASGQPASATLSVLVGIPEYEGTIRQTAISEPDADGWRTATLTASIDIYASTWSASANASSASGNITKTFYLSVY